MAARALVTSLRCAITYDRNKLLPKCSLLRTINTDQRSREKQLIEVEEINVNLAQLDPFSHASEGQKTFLDNIAPPIKRSYNFAAYVNSSPSLQELVKLGVSLYDIENRSRGSAIYIVALDFQRDCVPYIKFLVDHGLKKENLGRFISEFPSIFQVPIDELQIRLEYLIWKKFTAKQISQALNRSSQILYHQTKDLNDKLEEFRKEFMLTNRSMRSIVAKYPPVISLPVGQYKLTCFTLTEEFGFTASQMHTILECQPRLLDIVRPVLIERLDLIHNTIGFSHKMITLFPKLITGPRLDIKYRSSYLKKLRRDQYNPEKPLYVSPSALYNGNDEDFCHKYAKTTLEDFKLFVKSC